MQNIDMTKISTVDIKNNWQNINEILGL